MTHKIETGCLPYDDDSGWEVNIRVEPPNEYFGYVRVVLNPDSEFTDFDIADWPQVKAGIDRAIAAYHDLAPK